MNALKVSLIKTETSPGEFVTEGAEIMVAAAGSEFNGKVVYKSRFASKALVKAAVLTADERFLGFVIEIDPETATLAGKQNLRLIADADRFNHIKQVATMEVDVDLVVDAIKVMGGNNVATGETPADGSEPTEG